MTIQLKSLLAASLLSIQLAAHAQPKVWEQHVRVSRQVGDVALSMNRGSSSTPRDFYALAENKMSRIRAEFQGACSELVAVNVLTLDSPSNLERFLAPQSGPDLPIHDVLQVMREALAEQCEQLQVVRITFRPFLPMQGAISYEGTLTKTGGWRLQDGRINTSYDNAYVFEIRARDASSAVGLNFKGSCEKEPTLLLGASPAGLKALSLEHYVDAVLAASPQYAKECPGVTRIRYAIDPMPGAVLCKKEGDCFLEASFGKEWVVDASQFKVEEKENNRPIRNVKDMAEVLAAGRFDIVEDYRPFFSFFVMSYFIAYAEHCESHIREPVRRQIKFKKQNGDSIGELNREGDFITIDMKVEKEYANVFDAHFGPGSRWQIIRGFSIATDPRHASSPMDGASAAVGSMLADMEQMREAIKGCTGDRVLTVQQNMVNFARSRPPVTGKYATEKKPKMKYPPTGPSAPAFTAAYLEKRERARHEEKQDSNPPSRLNATKDAASVPATPSQQDDSVPPASTSIGTVQPNAPAAASMPAPPGKDSTNDAKDRAAAMQELRRAHAHESSEALKEFQAKMKSATPQERRTLQLEFRQRQQERQQELQRRMLELSGR